MAVGEFLNPAKAVRAARIQEGMKVADFGSGSGFFTRAAARLAGHTGVVWAIDADRALLSRLKSLAREEGLRNVEIVTGDIEARQGSHLPAESVDLVIVSNVLFASEHKHALVEETWRVLNAKGRAIVIDWKDSFGGLGPHKDHVITAAQARKLFEAGGYEFAEDIPSGEYHWGFILRKKQA